MNNYDIYGLHEEEWFNQLQLGEGKLKVLSGKSI